MMKKNYIAFIALCLMGSVYAADIDVTQGLLHLYLNEKAGTFTLTGFDPLGVERKLLSAYGKGSTSFFAVNFDQRFYHLIKKFGTTVKTESTGADSARMMYTVKDKVDVIIDFTFFQTIDAPSPDSVKVNVALRNIVPDSGVVENDTKEYALKVVFDTILGEAESEYFSSYLQGHINSERLFSHNLERHRWFRTKNRDDFSFAVIVAGAPTITVPASVHMANIDILSVQDNWNPPYVYDRSFDSWNNFNNAGIQLAWDPVQLAPLTEKEYTFYLTLADPEKLLTTIGGAPPPSTDYFSSEDDVYALAEYVPTEESIQQLIERILELESYPDSNQEELAALNNLLDSLLQQMESPYDEYGDYADY